MLSGKYLCGYEKCQKEKDSINYFGLAICHKNIFRRNQKLNLSPERGQIDSTKPKKGSAKTKRAVFIRPTLSAAQKHSEAYLRRMSDNKWKPPPSLSKLLQEDHVHDPWRVLVICILLNRTKGRQVREVLPMLFKLCPNANAATKVPIEALVSVLRPLGLQNWRANKLKKFSKQYLEDSWTHVTQLRGIGKYAANAYAILCTWKM